eukprot:357663-Chlamydomonas_euryale.AAC.16
MQLICGCSFVQGTISNNREQSTLPNKLAASNDDAIEERGSCAKSAHDQFVMQVDQASWLSKKRLIC